MKTVYFRYMGEDYAFKCQEDFANHNFDNCQTSEQIFVDGDLVGFFLHQVGNAVFLTLSDPYNNEQNIFNS